MTRRARIIAPWALRLIWAGHHGPRKTAGQMRAEWVVWRICGEAELASLFRSARSGA